jgi:tRNA (adenine37-N6)-methyltransferase
MDFVMRAIGTIRSPFTDPAQTPIQSARSSAPGQVEVDPEFEAGLQDIDGFSHIILLYVLHAASGFDLQVQPFLDSQKHGLFATRYPFRPHPIGLSVVPLLGRRGNAWDIEDVDMLDGTPLLDIKPYVPEFDVWADVRSGWYEHRSKA